MAFHELVTNAVKYGGLSNPEGRIVVSWQLRPDRVVELNWTEINLSPSSDGNSERSGFGQRLLKMTIEDQLGGTLEREILNQEFRFKMAFPVSRDDDA